MTAMIHVKIVTMDWPYKITVTNIRNVRRRLGHGNSNTLKGVT